MSIEEDLTQLSDHLHKAQGLIDVVLQKLGATGFTPASTLPAAPPSTPLVPKTLAPFPELVKGAYVTIIGEIVDNPEIREVETREGPKSVANVLVTDGKQTVRLGLWEGLATAIGTYQKGEIVTVTSLRVKDPYDGVIQLGSTKNTQIS